METNQDVASNAAGNAVYLGGKSWVAYAGIYARLLIVSLVCALILYIRNSWWQIAALLESMVLIVMGYRWFYLRSIKLYYDDVGVWLYTGVLPWRRGVIGVKWRDLDEAKFTNSFSSWLARSYTVEVRHRFTKASEIQVTNMANGKQAAITINQQLQQRIRDGVSM